MIRVKIENTNLPCENTKIDIWYNSNLCLWCNCGKNCKSIHFARFSDCAAIVTGACQGIGEGILYALRRKNEKVCSN